MVGPHDAPVRVDVWLLPLTAARTIDTFSDEDRDRGRRYLREEDAVRASSSNYLLRHAAALLLGTEPDEVRIQRFCATCARVGDHGRPIVIDAHGRRDRTAHLSSSHGGGYIGVAASGSAEVGIDIEPCANALGDETDSLVLTGAEQEELSAVSAADKGIHRLATWVKKEAVLKATGIGLSVEPTSVQITGWQVQGCSPALAPFLANGVRVLSVPGVPGHIAAVAVLTSAEADIVVHHMSYDGIQKRLVETGSAPGTG